MLKIADAGSAPGALFVIILIEAFIIMQHWTQKGEKRFLNNKFPTKQRFSLEFVA